MKKSALLIIIALCSLAAGQRYPGRNLLEDLDDVSITAPDTASILIFDGEYWKDTLISLDSVSYSAFAETSGHAYTCDSAYWPDSAIVNTWVIVPDTVLFAWSCDTCDSAGVAAFSDSCRIASYADSARHALFSDSSGLAAFADSARIAAFVDSARVSALADSARIAVSAAYADSAGFPDSVAVNNWVVIGTDTTFFKFRIDDTADTALQLRGAWGLVRDGATMHGNADSTHINLGVACTTGTSGQNYKYHAVLGGNGNRATGATYPSVVAGGIGNKATGGGSSVLGGRINTASGQYSFNGGGYSNTASGAYSVNSGGRANKATGSYSTVSGGAYCKANGNYSFAVGGNETEADSVSARGVYSGVFGGWHNAAGDATTDTLSWVFQSFYSYATGKYSGVLASDSSYATGLNSFCFVCSNDTNALDSTLLIGRAVKLINIKTPLRLLDSAQVWDDIRIAGAEFGAGAGSPVYETVIGNLRTYGLKGLAGIDEISAGTQLSHQTKAGSTLRPHYHWRVKDVPSGAQDTVKVFLAYGIFQYDTLEAGHLDTMITYMVITAADTGKTMYSPIGNVTAPNTLSAMIPVTIWRDASDAEDTYGGTWYLWEFDIHYQKDALGSKQERVK